MHSADEKNIILCIAPHPDDETLGCGGSLLRHVAEGEQVHEHLDDVIVGVLVVIEQHDIVESCFAFLLLLSGLAFDGGAGQGTGHHKREDLSVT